MFDPLSVAILGGLNLGMSGLQSAQAAKQRKQESLMRAAEYETSPWTGRGPSTQVSAAINPWSQLAGGVVNTLSQAQALEKASNEADAAKQQAAAAKQKMGWNEMLMNKVGGIKPENLSIDQLIALSKI